MSLLLDHSLDPARIALAIDALCVGSMHPVLAHVSAEPRPAGCDGAFGLYCTPLHELDTIEEVTVVLEAVTIPSGWLAAALCAPTSVRVSDVPSGRRAAWFVHVVTRDHGRASRLAVPGDHSLSGPATVPRHRLDRCLGRFVGAAAPVTAR